jgi:hypothetical protein
MSKDMREMIDKVKNFKQFVNENVANIIVDDEQKIIYDILSLNEGVGGDILQKIKDYGKKGLLTATIILSVAFSSQAQQQNKTDNVIKIGVESVDTTQQKLIYAALIGMATESVELSMRKGNIYASAAFIEIAKYYENLRDGKIPLQLSLNGIKHLKVLSNMYTQLDKEKIEGFIQKGKTITRK